MKFALLVLILLLNTFPSYSQNPQERFFLRDQSDIILVLNEEVIGGMDLLRTIPPEQLKDFNIQRQKEQQSSKNTLFRDSSRNVKWMSATTDFKIDAKTQEELNNFFGLDPDSDLYVNGFLLEKSYEISSSSIAKIEILEPDNILLNQRILNITLK